MTVSQERMDRGHGSQNYQYNPAYEEFCHLIQLMSPVAYQHFCSHFRAWITRSFQQCQAASPRFPLGITEQTFALAEKYITDLHYTQFLALSCDDTKLLASLCMYHDKQQDTWFLVGATIEPIPVADPKALRQTLMDAHLQKATKVILSP
ncbi:hypothetical protein K439DRAFT_1333738 [Ramaria rubella]|nr:hypothetical protein K439DRAFT_1333738 [Ramaria rubella]